MTGDSTYLILEGRYIVRNYQCFGPVNQGLNWKVT